MSGGGTPSQVWGYPISGRGYPGYPPRPEMGYPPNQTWDGVTLPARPGMGYPSPSQSWDGVPPLTIQTWMGCLPQDVNRQTPVKTVPSRHTTYAGGKYEPAVILTTPVRSMRDGYVFTLSAHRGQGVKGYPAHWCLVPGPFLGEGVPQSDHRTVVTLPVRIRTGVSPPLPPISQDHDRSTPFRSPLARTRTGVPSPCPPPPAWTRT